LYILRGSRFYSKKKIFFQIIFVLFENLFKVGIMILRNSHIFEIDSKDPRIIRGYLSIYRNVNISTRIRPIWITEPSVKIRLFNSRLMG